MKKKNPILDFYERDFEHTLFPLNTNRIVISTQSQKIIDYIYQKVLRNTVESESFIPQTRAYASKHDMNLRRTFKLHPVEEFFIYEFVHRNRKSFRSNLTKNRYSYGYKFSSGIIESPSSSYREFKKNIYDSQIEYEYCIKFDIQSYFNSVYHHDVESWFRGISKNEDEPKYLGQFLREINSGRSIDCLPQGIMPCKIIGSNYLSFVDNANRIKSPLMHRFMDDFYIFSSEKSELLEDFYLIQRMLGERGLSINPQKTQIVSLHETDILREIDEIKISLLKEREKIVDSDYDSTNDSSLDYYEVEEEFDSLSEEQEEYLFDLLATENIPEEDAELILVLMGEHSESVIEYLEDFILRFPNLSKSIYQYCEYIYDKNGIADIIENILDTSYNYITEYQLFWMAKILEDHFIFSFY